MWMIKTVNGRGTAQGRAMIANIERTLEREARAGVKRMAQTLAKLERGWQEALETELAYVIETVDAKQALKKVQRTRGSGEPAAQSSATLKFQVSSRFLRECWAYLTSDPQGRERMHLVSGPITPNDLRILSQIEKVDYDEQSAAYVSASANDTHRRLIDLEKDGHQLLAMFHSHIMHGAESTQPSVVDLANQRRFVSIGWDAIGGIFSLDGYIRLFGTNKEIEVALYGSGAQIISRGTHEVILKLEI
jgi:hypothetical protein